MKKIIIAAVLLFGAITNAAGKVDWQMSNSTFTKGDIVASALVGFNVWGYEGATVPVKLAGEYCIVDKLINGNNGSIGVGLSVGFAPTKYKPVQDWVCTTNNLIIGAVGSFHYQFVDNLDTYASVTLGYHAAFRTDQQQIAPHQSDSYVQSSVAYGFNLGARYYFTPNFAVCGELGFGLSILSVGVSYKF